MKEYEAPEAKLITLEVCDVITTSEIIDIPENLITWGSAVGVVNSGEMSFFD